MAQLPNKTKPAALIPEVEAVVISPPQPIALELAEAFRLLGLVDPFVRLNLWPQWSERGFRICDACGYVLEPKSGICSANPHHVGAAYSPHGSVRTIQL